MDKSAIYRKTVKGQAEISTTERTVDRRLRPLLILVDGHRTATRIQSLVNGIGIREEDFDRLVEGGFIERITPPNAAMAANDGIGPASDIIVDAIVAAPARQQPAVKRGSASDTLVDAIVAAPARQQSAVRRGSVDRFTDGQRYLTETAADKLGLRSFLFVLKIEKCGTVEDLIGILPDFEQALARKFDESYARHCVKIARAVLAD